MQQEQVIINSLIHNESFCRKVLPYLLPEYFPDAAYQEVFKTISAFVGKYNVMPTTEALMVEIGNKPLGEGLHNTAMELVQQSEEVSNDLGWLMDSTEKWAQDRAIYNGLMQSISIMDGKDKNLDRNIIPTIMTRALSVCFDSRLGHDYFKDAEAQWEYYNNVDNKIPFNIEIMNKVTKGGCTKKTLNVVQAGINVGKTTWLINMADQYLDQGLNVVYFTLEVAEQVIRERADACINDICFDDLRALSKIAYLGKIAAIRKKTKGSFKIKEFPTGSAHVGHLRHALNEMKLKEGFVPDVIIVDYLTLMLSSILPGSAKGNSNTYYTSVAEELRGLMVEFNVVGWTAAQFNRDGQDKEEIQMKDMGLAIGIAATADFMVALMSPEELSKMGKALGKILKNRYANKAAILRFMLNLNNDKQQFTDADDGEQRGVMEESEFKVFSAMKKPTPVSEKSRDWSFGDEQITT